jgi:hypothetical protein
MTAMNEFTGSPTCYYMQRVRRARWKRNLATLRLVAYCLFAVMTIPIAFVVGIGWLASMG